MEVIFCRNKLPFSLLIRLFTWSKWSHCGVIVGDNVIHATGAKGVICEPLSEVKNRYKWEIRYIDGDASKAEDLLGCDYDFGGVFGHWFGAWDDMKKWFCSELVAYCSFIFDRNSKSRITPQHCYMVSKPLQLKRH